MTNGRDVGFAAKHGMVLPKQMALRRGSFVVNGAAMIQLFGLFFFILIITMKVS